MKSTRTRPLLAALAAAVVAVTGAVAAPSAEAAPTTIRVFSHNLEKNPAALEAVIAEANARPGPEVLILQEVCGSMIGRLQDVGYTTFRHRRNTDNCGADQRIGEAVVWNGGGGWKGAVSVNLHAEPVDGHLYGLTCLDLAHDGRSIRACSTHLVAGGSANDAFRHDLTRAIKATVGPWIAGKDVVIVGGDFNSEPTTATMNAIYGVGSASAGQFRELAQMEGGGSTARGGKATFWKKKIDYVFASVKGTRSSGGNQNVKESPSDHRMLFGAVPLG